MCACVWENAEGKGVVINGRGISFFGGKEFFLSDQDRRQQENLCEEELGCVRVGLWALRWCL